MTAGISEQEHFDTATEKAHGFGAFIPSLVRLNRHADVEGFGEFLADGAATEDHRHGLVGASVLWAGQNMKIVRCAIYTRKSSEEGLGQEFNSLDAQREACASYIASQKHEGWVLVPEYYDDGGISGGTLERAGLKRLLKDIDSGTVD